MVNPLPHTLVKQVYVYFFFKLSKSARLSENQSFTIVLGLEGICRGWIMENTGKYDQIMQIFESSIDILSGCH